MCVCARTSVVSNEIFPLIFSVKRKLIIGHTKTVDKDIFLLLMSKFQHSHHWYIFSNNIFAIYV